MGKDIDFSQKTSTKFLVRIKTGNIEYEGILFNPFPEMRLSDSLARTEGFLNLKDARDTSSDARYPFVVINKAFIETIKVVDER